MLKRLTGDDYFRQLAREYQREHPSPSGNLFHVGAKIPSWLERRFGGTQYDYFSHVAHLEWACQEVTAAASHGPLDLSGLARVSPADYGRVRFELDPAMRLVSSVYPIIRIWEAHQSEREPEVIDIGTGGEQGLVQRCEGGVSIYRLSPGEYACLSAFRVARPLRSAFDEVTVIDPSFDLQSALCRWVELGFIVNFSVLGESVDA